MGIYSNTNPTYDAKIDDTSDVEENELVTAGQLDN
jgi:hypothetical protein